jgi:hypothetical protein
MIRWVQTPSKVPRQIERPRMSHRFQFTFVHWLLLGLVAAGSVCFTGCGEDPPEGLTGNPDTDDEDPAPVNAGGVKQPNGTSPAANTPGGASPGATTPGTNTPGATTPGATTPGATSPGTTKTPSQPVLPPPVAESAADRAAAEMVLAAGGRIATGREGAWIRTKDMLPAGPFRLVRVDLHDCSIEGEALAKLNGLEQLEQLDLSESPLTDEQLAQLTAAPALGQLNLSETSVTDAGLKALHAFKSLKRVELPARASDAAIAELKAALPECQAVK